MASFADRLARLTPAQRARLAAQIAGPMKKGTSSPEAEPGEGATTDLQQAENYCFTLGTPGNFASIRPQSVDRIPPGPGQIQIEAKAVGMNFRDLMIAMGLYPASPGVPSVMGSDYAGVVTACGEGVEDFEPGDEVMALSAGTMSPDGRVLEDRHICAVPNIAAQQAVPKPPQISFADAAGVPTVFLTSYYALCHAARLQRGDRVLIHSATGGVGLAAIEIARWIGADVFATAGSEEKRDFLVSLGIEAPMDSRSTAFADEVLSQTDGEGVDVILNTLSGPAVEKGLEILRLFGRFLQVDKKDIAEGRSLDLTPFKRALTFTTIDLSLFFLRPDELKKLFLEIADHLKRAHFSPVRTTTFPVAKLADALTLMSRYQHMGKLVLSFE